MTKERFIREMQEEGFTAEEIQEAVELEEMIIEDSSIIASSND